MPVKRISDAQISFCRSSPRTGNQIPRIMQSVNIVSTNYSRYGVSVYDRLYRKDKNVSAKHRPSSTGVYGHDASTVDHASRSNNNLNLTRSTSAISESDDVATISTNNSRRSVIKRKYKSLITASSKKLITKLYEHGSNSDSFSIFSHKTSQSHHPAQRLGTEEDLIINDLFKRKEISDLPDEVLRNILSNVKDDQRTLVNCLYVNKAFYNATKPTLYERPKFTSTYRVAQFVTSIRTNPQNGLYVRELDLSKLKNGSLNGKSISNTGVVADSPDVDEYNPMRTRTGSVTSFTSVTSTANSNTALSITTNNKDVALAGWRDWRYRHDPLYSSPVLNSYNAKRTVSRAPSIKSSHSSSSLTLFPGLKSKESFAQLSEGKSSDNGNNGKRQRSNSSVSSITNSLMSSLYNGSHISLNTTLSGSDNNSSKTQSKGKSSSSPGNPNDSSGEQDSIISSSSQIDTNTFGMTSSKSTSSTSNWFRMKLHGNGTRKLRLRSNKAISSKKDEQQNEESAQTAQKIETPIIKRTEPFSTPHPYTNKFLLKYAQYKDLPLGYILHILDHCPYLYILDLSNLTLCTDFEIIEGRRYKGRKQRFGSSRALPVVQESVISTDVPNDLDVIYLTDSSKTYEYYDRLRNTNKHKRSSSSNNLWSIPNQGWSDAPAPIGSHKNDLRRTHSQTIGRSNVELRKLNASEIFEHIATNQKSAYSTHLRVYMKNVLWCTQDMVKSFVLENFDQQAENLVEDKSSEMFIPDMNFSFENSGLNRNFVWTCEGNLQEFIAMVVLDEVNRKDDLEIENLFNIKAERILTPTNGPERAPEVHYISNVFTVSYGFQSNKKREMKFRVTILKTDTPMYFSIKKLADDYTSVVIKLQTNKNVALHGSETADIINTDQGSVLPEDVPEDNNADDTNNGENTIAQPFSNDPKERIERITQEIVARLKDLRGSDLRRNIGENNYVRERFLL